MTNEIFLLIIFMILFLYQLLLLVKAIKRKENERFVLLAIFEISCGVFSRILIRYFDILPSSGFMPGLTYLAHSLYSYIAFGVYVIMFALTIMSWIIVRRKS